MRSREGTPVWSVAGVLLLIGVIVAVAGCGKNGEDEGPAPTGEVVVAISGADMKPDGSLTEGGLAKIRAQSGAPKLVVSFFRNPASDAGLKQLAGFPNITRVEASGSKITDRGVQEFKKKLPQAEVVK
jgi:hypothetical protein